GEETEAEIAPASLFGDRPGPGPGSHGRNGSPPGPGGRGQRGGPIIPGPGIGPRPGPDRDPNGAPWVRLWVGAGRESGVRPGDLVGSITNEAGVPGRALGAIQISGRFSIVDVAEDAADHIVREMRGVILRGKPVQIRRDREPAAPFVRPPGPHRGG
ncbi:MAG: DbpA RNA binding domain-containing protein, partial [Chloroflexota bacterium]|nr:DbpA RNA binding domain-containing protein [Chloroflexota bacterium]